MQIIKVISKIEQSTCWNKKEKAEIILADNNNFCDYILANIQMGKINDIDKIPYFENIEQFIDFCNANSEYQFYSEMVEAD